MCTKLIVEQGCDESLNQEKITPVTHTKQKYTKMPPEVKTVMKLLAGLYFRPHKKHQKWQQVLDSKIQVGGIPAHEIFDAYIEGTPEERRRQISNFSKHLPEWQKGPGDVRKKGRTNTRFQAPQEYAEITVLSD